MILVTHALVGTAITHTYSNYFAVFAGAFLSHYILDTIPHWHYAIPYIKSCVQDQSNHKTLFFQATFTREFIRIAVDTAVAFGLSLYLFGANSWITPVAVFGAILPDILVGASKVFPTRLLHIHYLFHRWMHTKIYLDGMPLAGITSQIIIIVIFLKLFRVY